ncbi:MAG TPA: hypothetical protein DIS90_06640 [Cytophagales bacterium]|nr:hypothetical protein [Cytophagales bacterium]
MKIIKSTLLGTRCIRAQEPSIQLFQLRNVFNQHRDALVARILSDLQGYIDFKFHQKPTRMELAEIWDNVAALRKKDVDLEYYQPLLKQVLKKDEVKLANDYFFLEIDENIRKHLHPQLELVH